jgi:hypothetical protein
MKVKKTMSDTIYHHLGENWDMIFNVDDYYHLLEEFFEGEEEVLVVDTY